jgi:branched-chain amino acid transport system substrate-binding protein
LALATALLGGGLLAGMPAHAQSFKGEIVIGMQCDRTGPTQITGTTFCPAEHDYVAVINAKGGVGGYRIRLDEIDNNYQVPPAIEAFERHRQMGVVSYLIWGTPQALALKPRLEQAEIAGTSPGFGAAAAANGTAYPYVFPAAATYWSQGGAAIEFIKRKLGGQLAGKKIAYLYYDNPAGVEPLPVIKDIQSLEGFELRTFAVPAPGVEMGAQVLDIARRYRPDFVISHLFGRAPAVSMKELKRAGYPLSKVLGLVWASSEADIAAGGGMEAVEGYYTMQFTGVGPNYPILDDIRAMYKKDGKDPSVMDNTTYYNRGIQNVSLHVEAIRIAVEANGGKKPTGKEVKAGFEKIKNFTLGGIMGPLEITPEDHEGGGWVRIFQVKGGKFVADGDWMRGYRELVLRHVRPGS